MLTINELLSKRGPWGVAPWSGASLAADGPRSCVLEVLEL